ncbi:metallophosphoesterase family protein [Ascidiimonas sp. W6]|uniref:metallophosphoesterase family protein n=1 Tax=Ascidiimonas meishanensis TaxID=3128903 RepID=UPI0030EC822E
MKRILWISDIHLNGNKTDRETKKLLSSFISSLDAIAKAPDVLIISGDIAKSGSERTHYNQFQKLLIDPVREKFPVISIVCVPGNHDVNWDEVKKELVMHVLENPDDKNVITSFKETIGEKYFFNTFNQYERFHDKIKATNEMSDTFSAVTKIDSLAVITLNSAWLSIGSPVSGSEIKSRTVNKILNHSIEVEGADGNKVLFEELGNQTYGFTIPEVKKELDKISDKLLEEPYKDLFKILVVHHPPNNWLHWEELYSDRESEKSAFHNFIIDADIDLIVSGHEHTSLVEGGLLYGKSLVLYAGMFLDHHEKEYSNSWYKVLEIENETNPAQAIIKEKWYHYSNTDGGNWKEKTDFSMGYQGWKKVSNRLEAIVLKEHTEAKNEDATRKKAVKILSEAALKKRLKKQKITAEIIKEISKLTSCSEYVSRHIKPEGRGKQPIQVLSDENSVVFIINNVSDLFEDYDNNLEKNLYLYKIVSEMKEISRINIFVFYLYEDAKNILTKAESKKLKEIVQSKFEQFRHKIFKLDSVVENLKNANFAIRNFNE